MRQMTFAKGGDIVQQWRQVDADGQVLGRMATQIARVLMGKHRPDYTPHIDCGDFVVVINAENVVMTGDKLNQKMKSRYSGYPGGMKVTSYGELMEKKPEFVVEEAVRRMLPKGMLGRRMLKKLKVYRGAEHPHAAQSPVAMELK